MTRTLVKSKDEKANMKNASSTAGGNGSSPSDEGFNAVDYFKGVKQEWHRITWPTREQTIAETGIVLVVVAIFTTFIFLTDRIVGFLFSLIT